MGKKKSDFIAVWFNQEQKHLHASLIKEKLVSADFKEFVKAAFHEKVDATRARC